MLIAVNPNQRNRSGRTGKRVSECMKIDPNGHIVGRYRYTDATFDLHKLVAFLNYPASPRSNIETLPDYLL